MDGRMLERTLKAPRPVLTPSGAPTDPRQHRRGPALCSASQRPGRGQQAGQGASIWSAVVTALSANVSAARGVRTEQRGVIHLRRNYQNFWSALLCFAERREEDAS